MHMSAKVEVRSSRRETERPCVSKNNSGTSSGRGKKGDKYMINDEIYKSFCFQE